MLSSVGLVQTASLALERQSPCRLLPICKQELEPELVAASKIVVDNLDQCARLGELHHALAEGLLTTEAIHAELAEVVAGRNPGRTSREETIIFDSTGVAFEDVAAAAAVYEKALRSGSHRILDFAS